MNTPVVSVLMAVYNAEAYLDEALRSLLSEQTLSKIEVLAVDDASTDSSLAILQRYASDERLRIFRQERNLGAAKTRNLALKHVRGEYVCMVDADDKLSPNALASAVEVFCRFPQTDCVVFRLFSFGKEYPTPEVYPEPCALDSCLTGEEAFRMSLDWTLHGLYMVRVDIHKRYPFDDSYPLYSDDNTTRLHYLHSREVRFCRGIYYYRKYEQSCTSRFSPNRFLYMMANLSMRKILQKEKVEKEILAYYEKVRWWNYLSQLWLYFALRSQFTDEVCKELDNRFRMVYRTFRRILPFPLFRLGQWGRWKTKKYRK